MARNTRLPVVANTPTNGLEKRTIRHSDGSGEFSISYSRGNRGLLVGKDNFGDYTVSPSDEWGSMKLYKQFIIQDISYSVGEFVYVRPAYPDPEDGVERDFWVAKILQIRVASTKDVYALVAWLYWPEQLPHDTKPYTGRQAHHGERELVYSNYVDVIHVLSCAGKADVTHWYEKDNKGRPDNLHWRQTLHRETHQLLKD